jgi:hypothetical protein
MKSKIEGGSGGKRGHSNMAHWSTTEQIKSETKRLRRSDGKAVICRQVAELEDETKDYP